MEISVASYSIIEKSTTSHIILMAKVFLSFL